MLHSQQAVDLCYIVNKQWTHVTLSTASGPMLHGQQLLDHFTLSTTSGPMLLYQHPVDPCYTVNIQ